MDFFHKWPIMRKTCYAVICRQRNITKSKCTWLFPSCVSSCRNQAVDCNLPFADATQNRMNWMRSLFRKLDVHKIYMMTSSNGNIFRVTGPLCGEFTGPGEFPTQRPVTRSFDVFFDQGLNKRLNKHSWGWWFETLSSPLWRHRNLWVIDYSPL